MSNPSECSVRGKELGLGDGDEGIMELSDEFVGRHRLGFLLFRCYSSMSL